MKTSVEHQAESMFLPLLSSQAQGWDNLLVSQFRHPPGKATCHFSNEHAICLSLSPRPVRYLHVKGGKTHSSVYGKGDLTITPAQVPLLSHWEDEDHFLEIRIAAQFIERVARETLGKNSDQIELHSEFRLRDPQLEAIALLPIVKANRPIDRGHCSAVRIQKP